MIEKLNAQLKSLKYIAPIGVSSDALTIRVRAQNGYSDTYINVNVTEPNINPVALTAGYLSTNNTNYILALIYERYSLKRITITH